MLSTMPCRVQLFIHNIIPKLIKRMSQIKRLMHYGRTWILMAIWYIFSLCVFLSSGGSWGGGGGVGGGNRRTSLTLDELCFLIQFKKKAQIARESIKTSFQGPRPWHTIYCAPSLPPPPIKILDPLLFSFSLIHFPSKSVLYLNSFLPFPPFLIFLTFYIFLLLASFFSWLWSILFKQSLHIRNRQ